VRKVLGIVGAQFVLTFAMCLASAYYPAFGMAMNDIWVILLGLFLLIGCLIPLCITNLRRKVPLNYLLLLGFTFGESIFIASATANLTVESVLTSIGVFALLLSCLWCGALVAKTSAKLMLFLIISAVVACIFQITIMVTLLCCGYLYGSILGYAIAGLIVAAIYVIVDLVIIMIPGAISKDDYILGALMLYVDLLRLFMYILMIFGKRK